MGYHKLKELYQSVRQEKCSDSVLNKFAVIPLLLHASPFTVSGQFLATRDIEEEERNGDFNGRRAHCNLADNTMLAYLRGDRMHEMKYSCMCFVHRLLDDMIAVHIVCQT